MAGSGFPAAAATAATAVSTVGVPSMALQPPGQGLSGDSPVAVVVEVPMRWYAPGFLVTSGMRDTIPHYQTATGLDVEAFSFARADGHEGGIYPWKDAAAARAWFTPQGFDIPIPVPGRAGHRAWVRGVDPS